MGVADLIMSFSDHYRAIAPYYDELYDYYSEETVGVITKWLEVSSNDRVADVGAGSGAVSACLWKKADLSFPVLVVDPCLEMIEIARHKEGIATLHGTFRDFLKSSDLVKYNKIYFCGSVHHVVDLPAALREAYKGMMFGSQLLILKRDEPILFSRARNAKKTIASKEGHADKYSQYLADAGFKVVTGKEVHARRYIRDEVFESLRQRKYSILSLYSDEEIEEGIAELRETLFKDVTSVIIDEEYVIFKGIKD
jgi:ubiquinone/menaquinone biosynthesis C-methylase UbiE